MSSELKIGKRYPHKWGFDDTEFFLNEKGIAVVKGDRYPISGLELPRFMDFVNEGLDISVNISDTLQEVEKPIVEPNINETFLKAIKSFFDESLYTFDNEERTIRSHGQTPVDDYMKVMYDKLDRVVDMVFFCENEDSGKKLIELAHEHDVCLIPYGGGTNVSCALQVPTDESRMVVSLDVRRMNSIEWIDFENNLACVQAGMSGIELEKALQEHGYMFGHEPDSIELSTLGGWVSTNASGMKKNRYGNIEELVERIHCITPKGEITTRASSARQSTGSDVQQLLFGSEGNFGLITKVVIRIRRLPENSEYESVVFSDFHRGTAFMRDLQASGTPPASIRLVDNWQFRFAQALKPASSRMGAIKSKLQRFVLEKIRHMDLKSIAVATIVYEGAASEVEEQKQRVNKLVKRHGGIHAGASNGRGGYLLTYLIAYIRDFLAQFHIISETYETTVPWNKISVVCESVREEAIKKHKEFGLPGRPYISPRITQIYPSGVCIYFTHAFSTEGFQGSSIEVFSDVERHLRQVILDNGGSLSHHHGVGKLRASFIDQVHSEPSIEMLRNAKKTIDPKNIFGVKNNAFA